MVILLSVDILIKVSEQLQVLCQNDPIWNFYCSLDDKNIVRCMDCNVDISTKALDNNQTMKRVPHENLLKKKTII